MINVYLHIVKMYIQIKKLITLLHLSSKNKLGFKNLLYLFSYILYE